MTLPDFLFKFITKPSLDTKKIKFFETTGLIKVLNCISQFTLPLREFIETVDEDVLKIMSPSK